MRVDPRFNVEVTHVNQQPLKGAMAPPAEAPVEPKLPTDASRLTQGVRSQHSWPKTKFTRFLDPTLDPDQLRLSEAWRKLHPIDEAPESETLQPPPESLGEAWDRLMALVLGPGVQQLKNQDRLQQAISLAKQGKSQKAIGLLKRLVRTSPEEASAHGLLGHLLLEAENYQEAERHLQTAASYQPKDYGVQMDLGELYYQLGEDQLARQAFTQASHLGLRHSDPQAWLGVLDYEQGNMTGASQSLERAIQLDPSHAIARYYLAQVAFQLNDPLRANYQLQMVKQLQPTADLQRFETPSFSLPSGTPQPLETRRWQFPS